ncbi:MAG: hypothetical protein LBD53_00270 [Tannerella sp.]|jgi:hypothetical protein|nr:hypothetical protein [Tannerella sp.]
MTTVTARQFRATQKRFFDLAAKGERVVVRRRSDAFIIIPVVDDYYNPSMLAKIDEARQQVTEGKTTKAMNKDELAEYLDSL